MLVSLLYEYKDADIFSYKSVKNAGWILRVGKMDNASSHHCPVKFLNRPKEMR